LNIPDRKLNSLTGNWNSETDFDKRTGIGYMYLELLWEFFIPAVQENTAPLVLRACLQQRGVPPCFSDNVKSLFMWIGHPSHPTWHLWISVYGAFWFGGS